MIIALAFCLFPTGVLADAAANETIISITNNEAVDCGSPISITTKNIKFEKLRANQYYNPTAISTLYVKTITDVNTKKLKNSSEYQISKTDIHLISGKKAGFALDAGSTIDLPSTAKVDLEDLKAIDIPENVLDTTASAYYCLFISRKFAVVIQVTNSVEDIDKTALNEQLSRIDDENGVSRAGIYYTENDCYNGKEYTTGGAWNALTKAGGPYEKAKGTFTLQSEIETATANLKAAIDKLIPKTLANPTLLYEQLQKKWKYGYGIQEWGGTETAEFVTADNTTAYTWQPYITAFNEGRELLASLYDESGNPTASNSAILQPRIEELAKILRTSAQNFVKKESYEKAYKYYLDNKKKAFDILEQYNPSKYAETDYTPASWATFISAYETLDNDTKFPVRGSGSSEEYNAIAPFGRYITAVKQAARSLENSGEVTLGEFTYVNNFAARYPQSDHGDYIDVLHFDKNNEANQEYLKLSAGHTTAWDAIQTQICAFGAVDERTNPALYLETLNTYFKGTFMVFVDGEFVEIADQPTTNLHNGESVKIVRLATPAIMVEASTGETTSDTKPYPTRSEDVFGDSIADIKMSVPTEVKVGEEIEFSATLTGAYSSNLGAPLSPENITLFVSKPYDNMVSLADTQPIINTGKKTDASGKLSYVFTEPGTYAVAMYCVEPDEPTLTDILGITTIGTYNSVKAGDFAIVTVTASENETALLQSWSAKYLAEAKAYFDEFHDYDFAEGFYESELTPAYEALKEHIASANTYKGLVDGYKVDFDALKALGGQAFDHSSVIDDFRKRLSYIPEDDSKLDSGYVSLINGIKSDFETMNEHTKTLLSPAEMERIAHIVEIDVSALKTQPRVTVNISGVNLPYGGKIFWSSDTGGATYHGCPNLKYVITPNDDGTLTTPDYSKFPDWLSDNTLSAKARDHVFLQFYAPESSRSESKYWLMWSLDSQSWNEVPLKVIMNAEGAILGNTTPTYLPHDYFVLEYIIPDDVEDGSTINIDLKTVSQTEYKSYLVGDIKGDAIAAVNAAYDEYSKATNADAAKLAQIKADALAKIEAATTEADVTGARKAAVAAMAAAVTASAGGESGVIEPEASFNAGRQIGTVSLIIENTTYSGAPFTGTIAKGTYPLCENDSMMTVVLKALEAKGFNWNGTKGNVGDAGSSTGSHDYSISYLGSINKGEGSNNKELGEFDGGRKSGWMGTLNDWFVNESFSAFTVESGRLESGDEIHIMYTCDLGADIGGSWTAGDTAIKSIDFSVGKLAPVFDSDTSDYMLIIPSDSAKLKVNYDVRNMNYQSRIFLNYYNKESARYKKSDVLSVKSGDKLYIGVGDPSWPSMNNSGKGAKYTFSVCTLDDAIKALPAASTVKLANYKQYLSQAEQLEATIKAYGYSGNTEKLTALKEATVFYSGIDKAKELLAAVPKVEKLSKSDVSKVRAAKSAYDALSDDQKKYITVADAKKYNEAVEWLERNGVSTGGSIKGSEEVPEEVPQVVEATVSTVTANVETKATVTDGKATANVKVADITKAIETVTEQAKEQAKAEDNTVTVEKKVVLAIKADGNANAVEAKLPTEAVKELAKAEAKTVLQTDCGNIEIPSESMSSIADQAAGKDISVTVETKKATEVVENIGAEKLQQETGLDEKTVNEAIVVEVKINAGETTITSFGGKSIKLSLPVAEKQEIGKTYKVIAISEDGSIEVMTGVCVIKDGKKFVDVSSSHLTTFVVTTEEVKNPFTDVSANDYFFNPVLWAVENKVTSGKTADTFAPFESCTRAQMVTFLWRAAGSPWASANAHFNDVPEGAYYKDAVEWAIVSGITKGIGETTFAPNDVVTREQLASFIYRYAVEKGKGYTEAPTTKLDFSDASSVHAWADEAMHWCVEKGIVTGMGDKMLAPQNQANRAQIVTMLYRYFNL